MSASKKYPDVPLHHVTCGSNSDSVQDDWNLLSCDSVERNRSRRQAAAKRAKSFTLAYEQSGPNFGHRPPTSSGLRQRSSSTSGHLYVKAMNYSHGLPQYQRQPFQNTADQARILSTGNEYSTGQHRSPLWQDASQQGHGYSENNRPVDNNHFPIKLSYSDLSQDSAYHSRHNSSVMDAGGDPGNAGPYPFPGTKIPVHGRFPSWPEADKLPMYPAPTDCATHMEEIVSPRAAKRIYEEAAARKGRSMRLHSRPPVAPSQNYPNFPQEFGNPDNVDSSRYGATPVQPQRTKSFSGLSSMTQSPGPTMRYRSSNDLSQVAGGAGFRSSSGSVMTCRPFYNTCTQTDPSWMEADGDGRSLRGDREWPDVEVGNDRSAVTFLSEGGKAVDRECATTKPHPKEFCYAVDNQFLTQETSPPEMGFGSDDRLNRNIGSAGGLEGESLGQPKSNPSNQSSVIRKLSKEFYGQVGKRGIGLTNRMIIGGDRRQRLGSIDENTQIHEGSGYESHPALNTRRKSTDANRNSKASLYGMDSGGTVWRGSSLPPGVLAGDVNQFADENENLGCVVEGDAGDGSGFVRNRKTQMSLRKAFGIFDEIMDSSPGNVPRQESKSIRNADDREQEHRRDFEARLGSRSSLAPSDALRNHNRQPDDRLRQRSPEDRALHQASEANISPQSPRNLRMPQNLSEDISFRSNTGNHSLAYDRDSQKPLSNGLFETGWQRSPVDVDASQGQPINLSSVSFPGSDVSRAIARRKSESFPPQQDTLQDIAGRRLSSHDPGTGVLYTGTGVLSVNLIPPSESRQQLTEVHGGGGATDGRELDRTKPSTASSSPIIYRNSPSSSTIAMSPLPMYDAAGSPSSGSRSAASPAPPELPPRQYRKPDIIAGEDQVPAREGTELFSSNDSDVDSTLKRDTYAQQLRQEARRLSHSHSSSHALRRQPTLQSSNWKASSVSDNFSPQWDGQGEGEIGMAPLSERPAHYYSASSHMPLDGRIGENCDNEQTIEYAGAEPTSCAQNSSPSYRRVRNFSSEFSSGAAFEPTVDKPTEAEPRLSSPAMSAGPTSRSSDRFEAESGGRNWKSSVDATHLPIPSAPYGISSETSEADVRNQLESLSQTFSSTQGSSDGTEAEAKPKPRHKVRIHSANKTKERVDTAIVLPSVRSIESIPERDAGPQPASERAGKGTQATSGKVAKVKCLPRLGKSTDESAYECPASVDVHQLPDEEKHPPERSTHGRPSTSSSVRRSRHKQKHLSKESMYDDPTSVITQHLPVDERDPLAETSMHERPASAMIQQLPKDETCNHPKEPVYDHAALGVVQNLPEGEKKRPQPSARSRPTAVIIQHHSDSENRMSEASSDRPTSTVISQHPKDEKRSSGRFSSPLHKTAADYMTGLFTEEDGDNSSVQSDTLTRNSVQRASLRNRLLVARQAKENKERVSSSILAEESLSDGLRDIPLDGKTLVDDIKATSEEEKLELTCVLEKKLEILREERQLLDEEITENRILGRQVTAIVEQRLETKELSKYRSYVDELEKVLFLVLKLSDRLAKAENSIVALPQNASDKEKAALVSKRNDLAEKHVDALSLKEGIDRRRHQVAGYLQKCLSESELKDYEYFIKMKAQLVIDQQEVEDKIEMGQKQLDLLRSTLSSDFDPTSGSYFGPKSYC